MGVALLFYAVSLQDWHFSSRKSLCESNGLTVDRSEKEGIPMKKALVIALSLGLAAALSLPAGAQEAEPTVVPEVVNIEDPAGDANYLNDQGTAGIHGQTFGDNAGPADAGSVSDILKVWFTHDADVIRAHILTEVPPPATAAAYFFRVQVGPPGDENCLRFQLATTGPTYPDATEPAGSLRDLCGDADETYTDGITATIEELADGTGVSTIIVPRSTHPAFVDDAVLGTPTAHVRNWFATTATGGVTAPQIDDTKPGTDYAITAEEPTTKPPVKKGCSKGSAKAKKKGCKKS